MKIINKMLFYLGSLVFCWMFAIGVVVTMELLMLHGKQFSFGFEHLYYTVFVATIIWGIIVLASLTSKKEEAK